MQETSENPMQQDALSAQESYLLFLALGLGRYIEENGDPFVELARFNPDIK